MQNFFDDVQGEARYLVIWQEASQSGFCTPRVCFKLTGLRVFFLRAEALERNWNVEFQ